MKIKSVLRYVFALMLISSCSGSSNKLKSISIHNSPESRLDKTSMDTDTMEFITRPGSVLLTGDLTHRLIPVFKLNYNKKNESYYIGTSYKYYSYGDYADNETNNWNNNFMPGLEAVYGYNMVNVSLFNVDKLLQRDLFNNPVVINTLYFPSFSNDTLNNKPVKRNYYLVSVYDEDTNKDTFINTEDFRRFYYFDIEGINSFPLVPKNYSVISSQYDSANDKMFVYAQLDENKDGMLDETESIHIFWIDLKDPSHSGQFYH